MAHKTFRPFPISYTREGLSKIFPYLQELYTCMEFGRPLSKEIQRLALTLNNHIEYILRPQTMDVLFSTLGKSSERLVDMGAGFYILNYVGRTFVKDRATMRRFWINYVEALSRMPQPHTHVQAQEYKDNTFALFFLFGAFHGVDLNTNRKRIHGVLAPVTELYLSATSCEEDYELLRFVEMVHIHLCEHCARSMSQGIGTTWMNGPLSTRIASETLAACKKVIQRHESELFKFQASHDELLVLCTLMWQEILERRRYGIREGGLDTYRVILPLPYHIPYRDRYLLPFDNSPEKVVRGVKFPGYEGKGAYYKFQIHSINTMDDKLIHAGTVADVLGRVENTVTAQYMAEGPVLSFVADTIAFHQFACVRKGNARNWRADPTQPDLPYSRVIEEKVRHFIRGLPENHQASQAARERSLNILGHYPGDNETFVRQTDRTRRISMPASSSSLSSPRVAYVVTSPKVLAWITGQDS